MSEEKNLARALCALADPPLTRDLWPEIASRLQVKPRQKRMKEFGRWATVLACVALAMLVLYIPAQLEQRSSDELAALKRTSAELEQRLTYQRQHAARYSSRIAELERTLVQALELTDIQLSMAEDPERQRHLWQRRIALLSTWHDLGAFGADSSLSANSAEMLLPHSSSTTTIHEEDVL